MIKKIISFLDLHQKTEVVVSSIVFSAIYVILCFVEYFIPTSYSWSCLFFSLFVIAFIGYEFIEFVVSYYDSEYFDTYRTKTAVLIFVSSSLFSIVSVYAILYMHSKISGACDASSFFDCFYMSVITLTTVGYGDCVPIDNIARTSSIFEAITGFILLGVFVSSLITIYQKLSSY